MFQNEPSPLKLVEDHGLTIDDGFKDLLPHLLAGELEGLEKEIVEDGECHDPLVFWIDEEGKKVLIEGHHRYGICKNHGIPCRIREQSISGGRDAVIEWMFDHQGSRRNMNKFRWAVAILKLKPIYAERAKARQSAGGGSDRKKSSEPGETGKTMDILAKKVGMTAPTLRQVEFILEYAGQETIDKLDAGDPDYSINGVHKALLEAMDEGRGIKVVVKKRPPPETPAPNPVLEAIEKDIEAQYPHAEGRLQFFKEMEKWAHSKAGDLIVFLAQYEK